MTALSLVLAFLLVLANGFFVAAEFALVKVRSTQLTQRAEKGDKTAKLALHAVHNLDAYLSATQLGITLASIALGWVGEPAVSSLIEPPLERLGVSKGVTEGISFGVAFTLVSAFHIVLGELAPKSWAIQRAESLTMLVVRPLHLFYRVFRPIIGLMNGLAALILRPFGIHPASEHETAHSEDELRMLVAASGVSGVLNETEVEIAGQVLGFGDKKVEDVMVPRVEMVALDATLPLADNVALARSKPFSRYPVIDGDHDEILGMIHIKELFGLAVGEPGDLRSTCRDVLRVPVTKPLDRLLRDFQKERMHMAIVQDEYGGTAGIVTMENVLEELVGEIADEHDPAEGDFERLGADEWRVTGSVRLSRIAEATGLRLESEEHDTINGYVFESLGRPAQRGEVLRTEDAEITVLEADPRRARSLRLRRL